MKQIIFALAFIYCVFCAGPAYNLEDRLPENGQCYRGFDEANDNLYVSSCVDRDLYDIEYGYGYYDKCCYIRFRKEGKMYDGCIGLTREQFIDVPETIESIEKGKKRTNLIRNLENSKIYQLNCNSSYLQIFALSLALISLLF